MTSHSEFGHNTTAAEVADAFDGQIKGRIVAITGVSKGGLGGAAALEFAKHDPELLILVSRTQSKLEQIIADIKAIKPNANVKFVLVDLLSQASVRRAAEEINALAPRLDILVNNAALTVYKRQYSPEGIEAQLAANHIGPFLLTNLLKDRLVAAAKHSPAGATRVVNVSSEGHRASPFRFHDYNCEGKPVPPEEADTLQHWPEIFRQPAADGYLGFQAYGQSKTANILFTAGLNKRLAGTGVVSYALHPGAIATELSRSMGDSILSQIDEIMAQHNPKTIAEGTSTTMVAALDPALNNVTGVYLDDCQIAKPESYAVDPTNAEKLWELSEELVKQKF